MTVSWTPHRFSGGVLALDVANTVVLRGDPVLGFDRFDEPAELPRFAAAASAHCVQELGGRRLAVEDPAGVRPMVLSIRETTDRLFRELARDGLLDAGGLPPFLAACASGMAGCSERFGGEGRPFGDPALPMALETALAISALSLLEPSRRTRIRICAHCRWLFLDTSRNRSRIWCDMAVCGNRRKARRHYQRHKDREAVDA